MQNICIDSNFYNDGIILEMGERAKKNRKREGEYHMLIYPEISSLRSNHNFYLITFITDTHFFLI